METVASMPMVDYVAGDKAAPSRNREGAQPALDQFDGPEARAFADSPDWATATVYQDEFVNAWSQKAGQGLRPADYEFYALDNEPALWPAPTRASTRDPTDLRRDGGAHRARPPPEASRRSTPAPW